MVLYTTPRQINILLLHLIPYSHLISDCQSDDRVML